MTTLLDIDLETGDLSEFSYTETDGGDLSAAAGAALHGSYGLQAVVDDTTVIYAEADVTKVAGFRLRYYFDPNSLTMGNDTYIQLMSVKQWGGSYKKICYCLIRYLTASGYSLIFAGDNDAGSSSIWDGEALTDAVHYIEIKAVRATNSSSADGSYEWWLDGTSKGSVTSVDNYNLMFDQNWGVLLGIDGATAASSGTVYWDDLFMTDTPTTEIGAVVTGWTNISKINGIASASISKVNGVAVASISKVNGVAV